MNSEPESDLLAEVRKYIASATPEEVAADMLASDFEAYRGIGSCITAGDTDLQERIEYAPAEVLFAALFAKTDMITAVPAIPMKPFLAHQVMTASILINSDPVAGKHEVMPLAA